MNTLMNEDDERCDRPPPGWHCNLPAGHDGPCPTWKDAEPAERPNDVGFPWSFSLFVMLMVLALFSLCVPFPPRAKAAPVPRGTAPEPATVAAYPFQIKPAAAAAREKDARPADPEIPERERPDWRSDPDIQTRYFPMDCDRGPAVIHCDDPHCPHCSRCVYVQKVNPRHGK